MTRTQLVRGQPRTAEDSGNMADGEKVTRVSELTPALLQTVLRRSLASPALTVSRWAVVGGHGVT